MATAKLALELTTAGGQDLNDFVRIELFSTQGSQHFQANTPVKRKVKVAGIEVNPTTVYRVLIDASNYREVSFFQMLSGGQTTVAPASACPVDPKRVVDIAPPDFIGLDSELRRVLEASAIPRFLDPIGGFLKGERLYKALRSSPRLLACLLNIATKSSATTLGDGKSCLQHITGLIRVEQDRFFARTTGALFEETDNSALFQEADASLHGPIPDFHVVKSFKTFDRYGNLQLTFQRNPAGDYVVDADIDDAQGIEHIFQVLRNSVSGPTDPYNIHEILIKEQKLDPGYDFVFAKAATVIA